nr:DUF4407 domain-containing protein [Sphaerisporangium rubeum]
MRRLTGVDEEILASVPQERARYTSLGGIVLSTAVIASVSMSGALTLMAEMPYLVVLSAALLWGLSVANIDRFLITSMQGDSEGWSRWSTFVLRLMLAVVVGLFIAEPLTLKIFQDRLDQQIKLEQAQEISQAESRYKQCNPGTGIAPPSGLDCSGWILDGGEQAAAVGTTISQMQDSLEQKNRRLDQWKADLEKLSNRTASECFGVLIEGRTTGRAGVGPECKARRAELARFDRAHDIAGLEREVSALEKQINDMDAKRGAAEATRAGTISQKIAEKIKEKEAAFGEIGILERWEALGTVAAQSGMVNFAHWLLRIIFVLLDCMPIISKVLNGRTQYDRLVAGKLRSGASRYQARLKWEDRETTGTYENRLHEVDLRLKRERREMDLDQRINAVSRDEEIDRLAKEFMAGSAGTR